MSYSLHKEAEVDLVNAARFYRKEGGVKLADRFLHEFERVATLLVEFPAIGTPADGHRRVHTFRDFPYSVIYREVEDHIRILVIRSHHRDPEHGDSRR